MDSDKQVEDWDVNDVVAFLESIELHSISQLARDNALTGGDLVELTQDELQHDLGITRLQVCYYETDDVILAGTHMKEKFDKVGVARYTACVTPKQMSTALN